MDHGLSPLATHIIQVEAIHGGEQQDGEHGVELVDSSG